MGRVGDRATVLSLTSIAIFQSAAAVSLRLRVPLRYTQISQETQVTGGLRVLLLPTALPHALGDPYSLKGLRPSSGLRCP